MNRGTVKVGSIFIATFAAFACACGILSATTLTAQRGDTFIAEALPDSEFSKSDFLAVAHVKGERAITYIPFEFDAADIGISPPDDTVMTATLTLFIKKTPSIPESNAASAKGDKGEKPSENAPRPVPTASEIARYARQKLEAEARNRVVIEVYAIVDDETFEPNSKNYRVSWDGKTDAPAPMHNTRDDRLDTAGITKLGVIELDLTNETYDDGDRIEFSTDELRDYIAFAYGITSAHSQQPKFRTSLQKIRHGALILRQEAGPSGVFFYSADSFGENKDKIESGDEVKKKEKPENETAVEPEDSSQKSDSDSAAQNVQTPEQGQNETPPQNVSTSQEPSHNETPVVPVAETEIPKAAGSATKTPALEAYQQELDSKKSLEGAKPSEIKEENKKGNQPDTPTEKPDLRPKLDFEFRRDIASDLPQE